MLRTRARGSLRFPSAMLVGAPEGRGDDAGILHYIVDLVDFGGYFLGHFEHTGLAGSRNPGSGGRFGARRRCRGAPSTGRAVRLSWWVLLAAVLMPALGSR